MKVKVESKGKTKEERNGKKEDRGQKIRCIENQKSLVKKEEIHCGILAVRSECQLELKKPQSQT